MSLSALKFAAAATVSTPASPAALIAARSAADQIGLAKLMLITSAPFATAYSIASIS